MWKHIFKTSWRSLWKYKEFTLLNTLGLALGLAICLLVTFYVKDELGFDRFNAKFERIYRVNTDINYGGKATSFAISPAPVAVALVNEFSVVKNAVRLAPAVNMRFKKGDAVIQENQAVYCDPSIFDVFTLPMIDGDPKTALLEPYSMVITETAAKKYFGTIHALGETVYSVSDSATYRITGVIRDIPAQSHFHFDFFLSLRTIPSNYFDSRWGALKDNTYVLLEQGANYKRLEAQFPHLLEKNLGENTFDALNKNGNYFKFSLTPLKDIHLHSNRQRELDANGSIEYVYIFSSIALLILLIACINFINLSTARYASHAPEVGLQKVLGMSRKDFLIRFLLESVIVVLFSTIVAGLFVWVLLPLFNQMTGKELMMSWTTVKPMLPLLITVPFGVGILAGAYPAFFLSSAKPIDSLKSQRQSSGHFSGISNFRNILVVVQLVISTFLIIGTLVIYRQLNFIQHKDLGFDRSHVLVIDNVGGLKNPEVLKQEVTQLPGVMHATVSAFLPTNHNRYVNFVSTNTGKPLQVQFWSVDTDYLRTLEMSLLIGRSFSSELPTDSAAIMLNETAARMLAVPDDALSSTLEVSRHGQNKAYHVIGVVKDFNFNSLRDNVTPLVMVLGSSVMASLAVRVHTGHLPQLIAQIKDIWERIAPGQDFSYSFMDKDFELIYRGERRMANVFSAFAILAIVVASIGLIGLSAYVVERRTREIGIRKVLGASVGSIVGLLSRDFLRLILIAIVIASPFAWWTMNKWLQNFAYRTSMSWWMFVLAGALLIAIVLQTVGFRTIRAAMANPLRSIRTE